MNETARRALKVRVDTLNLDLAEAQTALANYEKTVDLCRQNISRLEGDIADLNEALSAPVGTCAIA